MTAIVGLIDATDKSMYLASDSCVSWHQNRHTRAHPKIAQQTIPCLDGTVLQALCGASGSQRQLQLFLHCFKPPIFTGTGESELLRYMLLDYAEAWRECLSRVGAVEIEKGAETGDIEIIVLVGGHIFVVASDFCVDEYAEAFFAIGSGADLARGVLYATAGRSAFHRVTLAVEAACHFDVGCQLPVSTMTIPSVPSGANAWPTTYAPYQAGRPDLMADELEGVVN